MNTINTKDLIPKSFYFDGKLMYDQGAQSYCLIKLRKAILEYYGLYKVKNRKFGYQIELFAGNYDAFLERAKELEKNRTQIPILINLVELEDEGNAN